MNGPADGEVDYKKKYRNLKRKLKFLIYVSAGEREGRRGAEWAGCGLDAGRTSGSGLTRCAKGGGGAHDGGRAVGRAPTVPSQEHECFQEELRKAQRKLLKVSRDKR